jgi:hypothetical protein
MPRAGWGWTIPPQLLVGAGLGLTVAGLTERALEGRPEDDEWRALIDGLQEQLDRAVTSAFSGPFLLAAALTLCALVPVAFMRRRVA